MSTLMGDEIKRWTARRKSALVLKIIRGRTAVAVASLAYDLPPSEIEKWVEDGKRGMENALHANPQDHLRGQCDRQLKDLQEAYGEAMLELRVRRNWSPCWWRRSDRDDPPETYRRRFHAVGQQTVSLDRIASKDRVLPTEKKAPIVQ